VPLAEGFDAIEAYPAAVPHPLEAASSYPLPPPWATVLFGRVL
jgi:hypothetical protein